MSLCSPESAQHLLQNKRINLNLPKFCDQFEAQVTSHLQAGNHLVNQSLEVSLVIEVFQDRLLCSITSKILFIYTEINTKKIERFLIKIPYE